MRTIFTLFLLDILRFGLLAAQTDIAGPPGSGEFGKTVTALPNGNFVVTDPGYDTPGQIANVGAVYLFDGVTNSIISTLTGSLAGDQVGDKGITVLGNGNYLVRSSLWNGRRGAITWCKGNVGVNGAVSTSNSLIGNTAKDEFGRSNIVLLKNGNYVMHCGDFDNGSIVDAGSVTWANAEVGITGIVSSVNSLVGGSASDAIASNVIALPGANYVVCSGYWDNGSASDAGAVTWCSGSSGRVGLISSTNSLVGSKNNDLVGFGGEPTVLILANGNYVVSSNRWGDGQRSNVGAVTWGNGDTGIVGAVSPANSLVGTHLNDNIGARGIFPLVNGNYIVSSDSWSSVGAVTWCDGTRLTVGAVSSENSLVGTNTNDGVGKKTLILTNGNYVVLSSTWSHSAIQSVGAVTWCDGTTGRVGPVTPLNSLIGTQANDDVGFFGIALANGNYLIGSTYWDNGSLSDAGAATWGNGAGGTVGPISAANSLVGTYANALVGDPIKALTNGNYVIGNGAAVTWGNGLGGTVGPVNESNSYIGNAAVGYAGVKGITALRNGNYVFSTYNGPAGSPDSVGAAIWASGLGGIGPRRALTGTTADDNVPSSIRPLPNGDYLAVCGRWDNGTASNAGAVTLCDGATGTSGVVSSENSLVGSSKDDRVGEVTAVPGEVTVFSDGNYAVRSSNWKNGSLAKAGAVSFSKGRQGITGPVLSTNSVLGNIANGGSTMNLSYDPSNSRLLVGYPAGNRVSLLSYPTDISIATASGFELVDGSATVDIGGALLGNIVTKTSIIRNTGGQNLLISGITIDGADSSRFAINNSGLQTLLSAGANTAFSISFNPGVLGLQTARLQIISNDNDESPYDITIQGTGSTATGLYNNWASEAGLQGNNAAAKATPFGDGVTNLLKYAFNLSGAQANVSLLTTDTGSFGLPIYSQRQIGSDGVFQVEFLRRIGSGLTYTAKYSTSLASYAPFTGPSEITPVNAFWERVKISQSYDASTTFKLFGIVEVGLPTNE